MAKIGIWIDLNEAQVIRIENQNLSKHTIKSAIDIGRVKGGSRSKSPWGPMDKVSESKQLAKREAQLKTYFENIADMLDSIDEVLISGPAQTKIRFKKFLEENRIILNKLVKIKTSDSMTDKQFIALVKEYYGSSAVEKNL